MAVVAKRHHRHIDVRRPSVTSALTGQQQRELLLLELADIQRLAHMVDAAGRAR
jgi:hypothetical protein